MMARTRRTLGAALAALVALVALAAGCEPVGPVTLWVTVRSDLLPGEELAAIELSLPEEGLLSTTPITAADAEALRIGVGPIALRDREPQEGRRLLVRGLDASGAERVRRELLLDHLESKEVTLLLSRSCAGVVCAGAEQSCHAGACGDTRCLDGEQESCPPVECVLPSDCAPRAACATTTCLMGACVAFPDSLACGLGELCRPEAGCALPEGCEAGFADCDGEAANGCEASLADSPAHCGGCGLACANGAACEEGRCAPAPVQVAAAQDRFCALDAEGGVRCVGADVGAEEPLLSLIGPIVEVAANAYVDCVRNAEGRLFCRGRNYGGQLGRGFFGEEYTDFAPVEGLPAGVEEVAVGQDHACARVGGSVYCWGLGGEGELGNGDRDARHTATQVFGIEDAVRIGVGLDHSCALLSDGALYCWGDAGQGRLGLLRTEEDQLLPVRVPELPPAVAIAVGGIHTCAVTETSAVYCWGENSDGQLGDGTLVDHYTPDQVIGLPHREVLELVAGNRHTCALIRSAEPSIEGGEVYCWGLNEGGQLGELGLESRSEPRPVIGLQNAIDLDASWTNTCAVRARGGAACWGENELGELLPEALGPIVAPRRVAAL